MIDAALSHLEECPAISSRAAEKHLKNDPSNGPEQGRRIGSPLFF